MKWSKALSSPNLLIPNTPGISAGDSIGSVHPHFLLKPLLHLGTLQHSIKSQHVHHTYRVEDQDQERLTCSIHDKHFLISYSYQTQIQSLHCLALSIHWLIKVTDALEIWFMWLWPAVTDSFSAAVDFAANLKMMLRNVTAIAVRECWQLSTFGAVVPMAMFLLPVHLMAITFAMDWGKTDNLHICHLGGGAVAWLQLWQRKKLGCNP